jgi:hypothetical protein
MSVGDGELHRGLVMLQKEFFRPPEINGSEAPRQLARKLRWLCYRWRMASTRNPPGDPMTLGNMRNLGVQRLIAYCLNPACRHSALTDVSKYANEIEVPWFRLRVKCGNRRMAGR